MTTPYYSDEFVTLYHGDCRQVTEWLAADVLVTDPPYGMGYISNRVKDRERKPIQGDETTDLRDDALAAWGDRPAIVFGTWRQPRPTAMRHLLVWDKGNDLGTGDLTLPWGHTHEEVYIFGRGFVGGRVPSVLRVSKLHHQSVSRPDHPTPKPVNLIEQLIAKCPYGVISDPFAGSGSTLIAARNQRRKAIGVEIEERYCEIAANRLAQDVFDFGGAA
jgi:DNA modification methylase